MLNYKLTGVVVSADTWVVVECQMAPDHLKTLNLSPWMARSARTGDRVLLEYRQFGGGYGWIVTQILAE